VTPHEVETLRAGLAEVAAGRRFLLQGGDCAERFMDCAAEPIEQKLKILLQMSLVLTWGARVPTLRIARMAGQFAKPRSKETEMGPDGVEINAFRGDNVNSFDTSERTPDPARLVRGYFHSAATLNYARSLLSGGFADLHAASHWDLGFVQDEAHRRVYKEMVDRILSALDFMRVCGVADDPRTRTVRAPASLACCRTRFCVPPLRQCVLLCALPPCRDGGASRCALLVLFFARTLPDGVHVPRGCAFQCHAAGGRVHEPRGAAAVFRGGHDARRACCAAAASTAVPGAAAVDGCHHPSQRRKRRPRRRCARPPAAWERASRGCGGAHRGGLR
jgi:hypothetical protein